MTLDLNRRHAARLLTLAVALAGIGHAASAHDDDGDDAEGRGGLRSGKLFSSSNSPSGNEVLVYSRSATAGATLLGRVATQGVGTKAVFSQAPPVRRASKSSTSAGPWRVGPRGRAARSTS